MIQGWKQQVGAGVIGLFGMMGAADAATFDAGTLSSDPYLNTAMVGAGSLSDRYDFSISEPSGGFGSITNIPLNFCITPALDIAGLTMNIFDAGDNLLGGGGTWSGVLMPGSFYAQVTGTATGALGGAYTIALAASSTPLAQTPVPAAVWLLASGGLALFGLARRRRSRG